MFVSVYVGKLGHGAFGHVALWARYDENGRIVERVAAKDCHYPPPSLPTEMAFYNDGKQEMLREPYM